MHSEEHDEDDDDDDDDEEEEEEIETFHPDDLVLADDREEEEEQNALETFTESQPVQYQKEVEVVERKEANSIPSMYDYGSRALCGFPWHFFAKMRFERGCNDCVLCQEGHFVLSPSRNPSEQGDRHRFGGDHLLKLAVECVIPNAFGRNASNDDRGREQKGAVWVHRRARTLSHPPICVKAVRWH